MKVNLKQIAQLGLFFVIIVAFFGLTPVKETVTASTLPVTNLKTMPSKIQSLPIPASFGTPVEVIIPSINLDSKVLPVGTDKNGNMAVPSGSTKNVGWYKSGTPPGNVGTAVFDAHVFAAFDNLNNLKTGADIYVINNQSQKLHFVVSDTQTYALDTLSASTLFGQNGNTRELNLITCAGKLTPDKSTYDHRLIVFAKLAGIENA